MENISSLGALMQLFAYGKENVCFNGKTDLYSEGYSVSRFVNNTLDIPREGDTCRPMYIKSDKKINNITFKIGGGIITRIPLEFCNKLYGQQTIKDDYYLYKIPWNLICVTDIYRIKIPFNSIQFVIDSDNICNAELYIKYVYLDTKPRKELCNTDKQSNIKVFEWETFKINEDKKWNRLNFTGLSKGIFIENIDITKINSITLWFGRHQRFFYNKMMIELFVKKIGQDINYIQLDDAKNNFDEHIYTSSINFTRIDNISIQFDTEIEQNIRILNLRANALTYTDNVADLIYKYNVPEKLDAPEKLDKTDTIIDGDDTIIDELDTIIDDEYIIISL
jgi:hypothetical protein